MPLPNFEKQLESFGSRAFQSFMEDIADMFEQEFRSSIPQEGPSVDHHMPHMPRPFFPNFSKDRGPHRGGGNPRKHKPFSGLGDDFQEA